MVKITKDKGVNKDGFPTGGVDIGDSTGKVVVAADPTAAMGIATKQYVDAQVAGENEISEMNDVTLTSIQTGDILQWNGSAFVNFALGTIGTMAAQNANAVNISGGSITMGSLSNTSTLLVKNSSGTTLKTIIGTTSQESIINRNKNYASDNNNKIQNKQQ